eukprot:2036792-Amphidinium_carterae.1
MEPHTPLCDQSSERQSEPESGFALFIATGPGAVEANGVAASAWLAGPSDAYYLWWAEQKAGPALPPATF